MRKQSYSITEAIDILLLHKPYEVKVKTNVEGNLVSNSSLYSTYENRIIFKDKDGNFKRSHMGNMPLIDDTQPNNDPSFVISKTTSELLWRNIEKLTSIKFKLLFIRGIS